MAHPSEINRIVSDEVLAIARNPDLTYWIGRVSDGITSDTREKRMFFEMLTDSLAADTGIAPQDVQKGILIAHYRHAEAGLASV